MIQGAPIFICMVCGKRYRIPAGLSEGIYRCKNCGGILLALSEELPLEVKEAMHDQKNYFGKYILLKELGRGGMGIVYKAYQKEIGRFVAIKISLHPGDEEGFKRLHTEAKVVASLSHPHIMQLYDVGFQQGKYYIARQYIEGLTLDKAPLSLEEKLAILSKIALALDYAHRRGVVHRDVKPRNIIVDRDGNPYLMDFDLALGKFPAERITQKGLLIGTPIYMSPEQIKDKKNIDGRSDVYSLGVILYELLCQRPPFDAQTGEDLLQKILYEKPPPPRKLVPSIPQQLQNICLRALEKEKNKRYQTAKEFSLDLEKYLAGKLDQRLSMLARLSRAVRRNLLLGVTTLLGIFFIFEVLLGVTGIFGSNKLKHAEIYFSSGILSLTKAESMLSFEKPRYEIVEKLLISATNAFEKATLIYPEYSDAHFLQGRIHFIKGELADGKDKLSLAIKLNPKCIAFLITRGKIYLYEYFLDTALLEFISIKLGKAAKIFFNLLQIMQRQKTKKLQERILEEFELIRKLSRKEEEIFFAKGVLHFFKEKYSMAMDSFTKLIKIEPSWYEGYLMRSICYLKLEKIKDAMDDLEMASKFLPRHAAFFALKGFIFYMRGEYKEALYKFDKALACQLGIPKRYKRYIEFFIKDSKKQSR
jgi:serine/threonine protein kinase